MYSADWLLYCTVRVGGADYGLQSDDGPPTVLIRNEMQRKGCEKRKWMEEHGKSGVSTWPFEFKHMSDVVKTCQSGKKKTQRERERGKETLGHAG